MSNQLADENRTTLTDEAGNVITLDELFFWEEVPRVEMPGFWLPVDPRT